jgi:glyoxylase-like metal-dependent hydrolase (beta-lactamase superfamily II)
VAEVDVLVDGYARADGEVSRVAGTVSLVRAPGLTAIVDPGMVAHRDLILDPLRDLGVAPDEVTDVILSHHHPDHTVNIALFGGARVHDSWAVYHGDVWADRPAEGAELAPGVRLWETPGHTPQDVTTLVETADGTVALTHLWWHATMAGDPRATDLDAIHTHRARVLEVADLIVPGHGPAFEVTSSVPR